jgi:integrase
VIEPSDLEPQAKLAHQYQVGLLTSRFGHLKLDTLTPEHVETCLNDLRRNGGRNGQGYAASTVAHTRNTLRKALGHAVKNGRLTRNVAAYATPPKVHRPEVRPFTEEEAGRLLDTVAGHRLDTLYAVALTLGLRRGELLGLTWEDIDCQSATLHVRRQLEVLPGVKPHLKELLKTQAGRRDLTIPPDLLRRLREHQDRQHGERETAGAVWQDHGLVFPTSVGTPILPRNLARHYERLLHHAGLPQRRVHDLRHTFATLMFRRGLDVVKVSRILGHASVQITIDTYIHWLPKERGEAATIMDDFLLRRQRAAN